MVDVHGQVSGSNLDDASVLADDALAWDHAADPEDDQALAHDSEEHGLDLEDVSSKEVEDYHHHAKGLVALASPSQLNLVN